MEGTIKNKLLNELDFEYARSSGPGGQKVNKTSSQVRLRWSIGDSEVFTEETKEKIRTYLLTHRQSLITKEGEVIIKCDEEREQPRNKKIAIDRFFEIIEKALEKEKPWIRAKPKKSAKTKEEKRCRSELKKARQKIKYW